MGYTLFEQVKRMNPVDSGIKVICRVIEAQEKRLKALETDNKALRAHIASLDERTTGVMKIGGVTN
jgi:hypothetical protein